MAPTEAVLTSWFHEHRSFLWGLSYRITGSAADADDIVQETFVRAHQHEGAIARQELAESFRRHVASRRVGESARC